MTKYNVKNCPNSLHKKYQVIRECDGQYWWYNWYDDVTLACKVAHEIGNGLVVETDMVNPSF